jgi:hypothetical protein
MLMLAKKVKKVFHIAFTEVITEVENLLTPCVRFVTLLQFIGEYRVVRGCRHIRICK